MSQVYGTMEPPEYDLGRVPVPVLLYWGNDDWFSTRENVEALAAQIPRLIATIEVRKTNRGSALKSFKVTFI